MVERERSILSKSKRRGKALEFNMDSQMDFVLGAQRRNKIKKAFGEKRDADKIKAARADDRRNRRQELDRLVREHFSEEVIDLVTGADDGDDEEEEENQEKVDMCFEDDAAVITVETESMVRKTKSSKQSMDDEEENVEGDDEPVLSVEQQQIYNIHEDLAYYNQVEEVDMEDIEEVIQPKKVKETKNSRSREDMKKSDKVTQTSEEVQPKKKAKVSATKAVAIEETPKKTKKEAATKKISMVETVKELCDGKEVEKKAQTKVSAKKQSIKEEVNIVKNVKEVAKEVKEVKEVKKVKEAIKDVKKPKEVVKDVKKSKETIKETKEIVETEAVPAKDNKAKDSKKKKYEPITYFDDSIMPRGPVAVDIEQIKALDEVQTVDLQANPMTEYLFAVPLPSQWQDSLTEADDLKRRLKSGEITKKQYERELNAPKDDDNTKDLSLDIFGLGPASMNGRHRKNPLSKTKDNTSKARKERKQERLRTFEEKTAMKNAKSNDSWSFDLDGDVSDDVSELGSNNKKKRAHDRRKASEDRKSKFPKRPHSKSGRIGNAPLTRDSEKIVAAKKAGYYFGDKPGTVSF